MRRTIYIKSARQSFDIDDIVRFVFTNHKNYSLKLISLEYKSNAKNYFRVQGKSNDIKQFYSALSQSSYIYDSKLKLKFF